MCSGRQKNIWIIEYVFQKREDIPEGFSVPEGREKPWGTGHAALCAARSIDAPYAVINADDFYGRGVSENYQFLSNVGNEEKMSFAMVGYSLKKYSHGKRLCLPRCL